MSAYATVGQLIKAAYSDLGIVDIESELSPAQYEQGLQSLNAMMGGWSRKRMTLQGLFDESYTLVNGQAQYTVAVGADFNTAKPLDVDNAYIRDDNGVDYQLNVISGNEYDAISVKSLTTRPNSLNYNPRTGVAIFYPVPDRAYTLFWTVQKQLTSFASIEDAITLPEEYEEAMEYNLALRLAPKVNVKVPQEVGMIASLSMGSLLTSVEPAEFDGSFGTRGRYNIFSDSY